MACDGVKDGSAVGEMMLLPATFKGGPRDLWCKYMNALAIVAANGKPDFFLTFTCYTNWPEIKAELPPGEQVHNRADVVVRVFREKLEELKDKLIKKKLFGEVAAYMYVVEFQKRGLPHAHWLLILRPKFKVTSCESFDQYVTTEIPNPDTHPHLHSYVARHMIHDPCGEANPKNVYMRNGMCMSNYHKQNFENTTHLPNSYPAYRQRDNGRTVTARKKIFDNRWVVPYNAYLLAKFDCHVNIEIMVNMKVCKYLYKYVCKGHDMCAFNVVPDDPEKSVDEIKEFQKA